MKHNFYYDEETHITTCLLTDIKNNIKVSGIAKCHPEDEPYESKLTGQTIAYYRAVIKYYKTILRQEVMQKEKYYFHLYDIMVKNPEKYNNDGAEFKLLRKLYHTTLQEIKELRDLIKSQKEELKNYIEEKGKLQTYLKQKGQNQSI